MHNSSCSLQPPTRLYVSVVQSYRSNYESFCDRRGFSALANPTPLLLIDLGHSP